MTGAFGTRHELILNLHGVGEPPDWVRPVEQPYWLPAERLTALARLVRDSDRRDAIRLTFDDGNETDLTVALPILLAHGLSASFFISGERIGRPGFLSAAGIRRLSAAGMQIGSHGADHVDWTTVGRNLGTEVTVSLRRLSDIVERPVTEVAVPFGSYDAYVLRALRHAGVTRVYTSDNGIARKRAWLAPRNTIRSDMPLESIAFLIDNGFSPVRRLRLSLRVATQRLHWPLTRMLSGEFAR